MAKEKKIILELSKVQFKYPNSIRDVLRIPEFKVFKGEKVFLFGPSGSGKSTLLEIMAGILNVTSGDLRILDQSLASMKSHQRDQFRAQHIGYIFQSFNLLPYLSAEDNILLPLRLQNRVGELDEIQKITKALGINDVLFKKSRSLSIGQQQRVAAARALIVKPEILLADEPTSSLDYDHREKFIELLFKIAEERGTTIIFVSHDKQLEKLFDRRVSIQEMNKGF
jgi:putative ABC transport system ATP-binding protein